MTPSSHGPTPGPFVFLDPQGRRWRRIRLGLGLAVTVCIVALGIFIQAILHPSPLAPLPLHTPHFNHGTPITEAPLRPDWPAVHTPPSLSAGVRKPAATMRVAWHAPWDTRAWDVLRRHTSDLDAVVVEWMSLVDVEGHVRMESDERLDTLSSADEALGIYLVLNNLAQDRWQPEAVEELARSSPARQAEVLAPVWAEMERVRARGLVLHFEGLDPDLAESITALICSMAQTLHAQGRELWLAVPASRDANALSCAALASSVDRFIALLHTETAADEPPGPIASQPWFQGWLDALLEKGGQPEQWIIAIGNHGYEWQPQGAGKEISFVDAMERARRADSPQLTMDLPLLQPGLRYDVNGEERIVWFQDVVTFVNQVKYALSRGVSGILLYRLGTEDPGVWSIVWDQPGEPPTTIAPEGRVAHVGEGDSILAEDEETPGLRELVPLADGTWKSRFVLLPRCATVVHSGASTMPGQVVLSFDDGPDPRWTPAILDILKKWRVPAVFFVTGRNAERYPELIRRMADEGHLVANHSFFHPDIARISGPHAALELVSTTRIIETLTGRSPRLFRPPYLRDSLPATREELTALVRAQKQGLIVLGQSIDPRDYERPEAQEIALRVAEQLSQGRVLLLHDGGGDRSATVAALPQILEAIRDRGGQVVPVWELLNTDAAVLAPPAPPAPDTVVAGIGFSLWRILETGLWWVVAGCTVLVLVRTMVLLVLATWQIRRETPHTPWPLPVSILVPAHNEALTIGATVQSLLEQEHSPGIEVLILDDGSSDGTAEAAQKAGQGDPRLRVLRLPHGGKAAALNQGIAAARHEVLVMLDADTQLAPGAVGELAAYFHDPSVGAVSGTARASNRHRTLTRWQDLEYLCGFNLERRACHHIDGILVVPGAIGAWRKAALTAIGGFATDTLAEDTDATIALQRAGWRVRHQGRAVAWTQVPADMSSFIRQRFRWAFGTMQALWKHRAAMGDTRLRGLGIFTMPGTWFFQIVLVLGGPLLDLGLILSAASGVTTAAALALTVFLLLDLSLAAFALCVEGERLRDAWQVIPMRLVYRPLLAWAAWKAAIAMARGVWQGWTKAERHAITLARSAS